MFEGIFQPMHLIVILVVALLVFGPKKLPELGKGLGEAISGFKKAMHESEAAVTAAASAEPAAAPKNLSQKTDS